MGEKNQQKADLSFFWHKGEKKNPFILYCVQQMHSRNETSLYWHFIRTNAACFGAHEPLHNYINITRQSLRIFNFAK